jgi:hypothetical protein
MSSIYKKGRDGYYYYQVYVLNPKTKKNNKRIFRSLRTKDLKEARVKQKELDLKYEKNFFLNTYYLWISNNFKQTAVIIVGTIITTIIIGTTFKVGLATNDFKETSFSINNTLVESIYNNNFDSNERREDSGVTSVSLLGKEKPDSTKLSINIAEAPTVPQHSIERIEKISGLFKQGTFYVTIDKKTNKDSQRFLCEAIAQEYQEFSNISICLYTNSQVGISMASGRDVNINIQERKKSWLAMYTYNNVEGEYFNDNPTGYLGVY